MLSQMLYLIDTSRYFTRLSCVTSLKQICNAPNATCGIAKLHNNSLASYTRVHTEEQPRNESKCAEYSEYRVIPAASAVTIMRLSVLLLLLFSIVIKGDN